MGHKPNDAQKDLEKVKETASDVASFMKEYAKKVDKMFAESLSMVSSDRSVQKLLGRSGYEYDSDAIDQGIIKPAMYLLEAGGKRLRPAITYLVVEALGKNADNFIEFTLVPEVIHNATLIKDDIEDGSKYRRNRPTVHEAFGTPIAINVGDFMYFFPFAAITDSPKLSVETKFKIFSTFFKDMTRISLGQCTDIVWDTGSINPDKISSEKYLRMVNDKTGVLISFACKLGAILCDANEETVNALGKFGSKLGVAFQIQDDILNLFESSVSKSKGGVGEDITEGKKSLLVIKTLESASESDKERLEDLLNMHTKDPKLIAEAIAIIIKYGAREKAEQIALEELLRAWKDVDRLLPESKAKRMLGSISNFVISRNK